MLYVSAEKSWKMVGPVIQLFLDGEVNVDEDISKLFPFPMIEVGGPGRLKQPDSTQTSGMAGLPWAA